MMSCIADIFTWVISPYVWLVHDMKPFRHRWRQQNVQQGSKRHNNKSHKSNDTEQCWKLWMRASAEYRSPTVRACFCCTVLVQRGKLTKCSQVRQLPFTLNISSLLSVTAQMFKGFDKAKDIQYVYTPVFSSLCGVKLDSNNKAGYLLSGTVSMPYLYTSWGEMKPAQIQYQ